MSASASASLAANQPLVKLPTGFTMPAVGLGTWRSPNGEVEAAVYEGQTIWITHNLGSGGCALAVPISVLGYRHIDCARVYGRGLARAFKEGVVKREEVFVTSKVWNNAHSTKHAAADLKATLEELQLTYLDLYLIHWPVNYKYVEGNKFPTDDKGLTLRETDENVASIKLCWQEMERSVDAGLIRSIGVSNFSTQEIDDLLTYARIKPAAQQIEIHPYFQQDKMLEYCKKHNIVVQAYSPLGNLRNPGEEHLTPLNDVHIAEIAKRLNKTVAQVILRWGLQHVGVILPKSTTKSRIEENFIGILDFVLSAEDMAAIKKLGATNKRFCNPGISVDGSPFFKD